MPTDCHVRLHNSESLIAIYRLDSVPRKGERMMVNDPNILETFGEFFIVQQVVHVISKKQPPLRQDMGTQTVLLYVDPEFKDDMPGLGT